jgi:hypothetical protein
MTTAQFLPLTPTDVIFAAVIALKAYSVIGTNVSFQLDGSRTLSGELNLRLLFVVFNTENQKKGGLTDLVKTALV